MFPHSNIPRDPDEGYYVIAKQAPQLNIYDFPLRDGNKNLKRKRIRNKNVVKLKAEPAVVNHTSQSVSLNRKKPRFQENSLNHQPTQKKIFDKIVDVAHANKIFNLPLPSDELNELFNSNANPEVIDFTHIIKDYPLAKLSDDAIITKVDNEIKQTIYSTAVPKFVYQSWLKRVIDDLDKAFKIKGCTNKWNLFGSYLYEMVNKDSDIDVYYECVSNGTVNLSLQSIQKIMRKSLFKSKKFHGITFIGNARIPLIKAIHNETEKHIDISFSNSLGVRNSLLTKLYLNMSPNLKYLTLYLKWILRRYDILGTGKVTTHILFWLVSFFMQQKKLLPAVIDVRKSSTEKYDVIGWDCSLPDDYSYSSPSVSLYSLLLEFFVFYKEFDFLNYVICPFLGRAFLLSDFNQLRIPSDEFSVYLSQLKNPKQLTFSRGVVNLQDPSDLGFNLAKQIAVGYANKFKVICHCLSNLLPNSVSDLRKINYLCNILPNYMDIDRYLPYELVQYCDVTINLSNLPAYCVSELNHNYVLEAVHKIMKLVFGFEKDIIVAVPNIAQVYLFNKEFIKNTVSVIHYEYYSTENTWKNNIMKEIIPRNENEKEPIKVFLTSELNLERNLLRVLIQTQVDFSTFLHENSVRLFSFALKEVIPQP